MKTKKIITKRIKITARGKLLQRPAKQNHFLAKEKSKITRRKRKNKTVHHALDKIIRRKISI